jgi:hypothetical protein
MASTSQKVLGAIVGTAVVGGLGWWAWTRYGYARIVGKNAALWDDATATTSGGAADANIQAPLGTLVRRSGAPDNGYQPVVLDVAGQEPGRVWWTRTSNLGGLLG